MDNFHLFPKLKFQYREVWCLDEKRVILEILTICNKGKLENTYHLWRERSNKTITNPMRFDLEIGRFNFSLALYCITSYFPWVE